MLFKLGKLIRDIPAVSAPVAILYPEYLLRHTRFRHFFMYIDMLALEIRIETMLPTLNEYQRRRYLSGIPLISSAVIVSLIGDTKTENGLRVTCVLDDAIYESGLKVTDDELSEINLTLADFHGEWNYTIAPNKLSLVNVI